MSEVAGEWSFVMQFGMSIALLCAAAAIWQRWVHRLDLPSDDSDLRLLDQYEQTWLQFGRSAAIERAIGNLLRKGNLNATPDDPQRVTLKDFDGVTHPLEVDILDAVARYGTLQIGRIVSDVVTTVTPYRLARAGLIPQAGRKLVSMAPAMVVLPGMLCVGLFEAIERVAAGQSVVPVAVLTVAGSAAFVRLCLPARRTLQGEAVLRRLQETAPRRDRVTANLAIRVTPPMRKAA